MTSCDDCRGIRWCETCSDSKKPLLCRLTLHDWSIWTIPANYRVCFRCGLKETR